LGENAWTEAAGTVMGEAVCAISSEKHPFDMAESDVNAFLTDLAVERGVAASTQNQARCALNAIARWT
jgi:hypothetical protein